MYSKLDINLEYHFERLQHISCIEHEISNKWPNFNISLLFEEKLNDDVVAI